MYSFKNDYAEGAHPSILNALMECNLQQEDGYGEDSFTLKAKDLIIKAVDDSNANVHLLSGGTQTNLLAISAFLRPHEACIATDSGHISTHETGAIEATGHKVITVGNVDGKLNSEQIDSVLEEHHFEHMVKPKLVYISNPTEFGTVYSKVELKELSDTCKRNSLYLYIDGARLGAALTIKHSDVSLKDINNFSDAFFIGGTKNGALIGEALVISNKSLQEDFRYLLKQRGALLSKGRILGVQFCELFRDNLYYKLAEQSNDRAQLLTRSLKDCGCNFLIESPTNQIFPIMHNDVIDKLSENFSFYVWQKIDDEHSAIRLITSWATPETAVNEFIKSYQALI